MRVLFIGGTGNISAAASRAAIARGLDLYLLNRGARAADMPGASTLVADVHRPGEAADYRALYLLRDPRYGLKISRARYRKTGFDNVDTKSLKCQGNLDFLDCI